MLQEQRFSKHLSNFQCKIDLVTGSEGITAPYLGEISHQLYLNDARTPLFQLQALARIELEIGKDKETAKNWLEEFKSLEDAFGKYDFWYTLLQKNHEWESPKEILTVIEQQTQRHLGLLESTIQHYGWLPRCEVERKPMDRFTKYFKKYKWIKEGKETKKLLNFFRDEAESLHVKISSGDIDLNLIEDGIHELRRKLRWLGIYSSSLLGKVQHSDENEKSSLDHYITEENKLFKFNILPKPSENIETIQFLKGGFYALSILIDGLGKIKDPGLITEEMVKITQLTGSSISKLKPKMGPEFASHSKVVKEAKILVKPILIKYEILLHIADHFDKQL